MKNSEVVVHLDNNNNNQVSLTKKFYIQDIFNGRPIFYDAGEFGLRKKHIMVIYILISDLVSVHLFVRTFY